MALVLKFAFLGSFSSLMTCTHWKAKAKKICKTPRIQSPVSVQFARIMILVMGYREGYLDMHVQEAAVRNNSCHHADLDPC